MAVLTFVDCPF